MMYWSAYWSWWCSKITNWMIIVLAEEELDSWFLWVQGFSTEWTSWSPLIRQVRNPNRLPVPEEQDKVVTVYVIRVEDIGS